jgi:iron complex outermembrane recepter protein
MRNQVRAAVVSSLAIVAIGTFHTGRAQTAPPAAAGDAVTLETVLVTAQKREESLQDVPMGVSALGGSMLDDLQARDFSDYAALVPGLSLNTAQQGETRLTLRGQNAGGVGSTVAVYVDESPFGSSTALVNGAVNTGDFDTWDMQRIEVLRGPQGTLYGANSEGGLLKFVTNAPELNKFSVAGEGGAEDVQHGGNGGDGRAMVNLPFGDNVALRMSGFFDDMPGYIRDPASGQNDVNDGRKYGGRASLLIAATDTLSIRLTAESQTSNYDGTNLVDINPVTLKPLYGDLSQERVVPEPSHFQYENYNGTVDWNLGAVKVLSTTSYGILTANTVTDGTPIYGGLAAGLFGGTGSPLVGDTQLKKFTQEVRLSSADKDQFEWQVGGYYTHESGALEQSLNAVNAASGQILGQLIQPVVDSIYKEGAAFLDLTYHFNSQFDITAGGRWSSNSQTAVQSTLYNPTLAELLDVSPNPQVVNGDSSEHVWTYSVAPSWHIDKNDMVYARVATGYRPGGPNVLPPTAPDTVQREYGSDKTTNVEVGLRSNLDDGRLSLDIALFHVDWKNIQLLEEVAGFGINANGGTARSQGVEWTFAFIPVDGLTLQWTGAYTDAYLTSDAPDLNAVAGNRLPYAPKWGTGVDAEYKQTLFGDLSGFVGLTYSYVGAREADFASSSATPAGQVVLPSYNTYGARLGLEKGNYRLTFYGKNLSDSRGFTDYSSSGAPYSTVAVTQPLTLGVTLSAKF